MVLGRAAEQLRAVAVAALAAVLVLAAILAAILTAILTFACLHEARQFRRAGVFISFFQAIYLPTLVSFQFDYYYTTIS